MLSGVTNTWQKPNVFSRKHTVKFSTRFTSHGRKLLLASVDWLRPFALQLLFQRNKYCSFFHFCDLHFWHEQLVFFIFWLGKVGVNTDYRRCSPRFCSYNEKSQILRNLRECNCWNKKPATVETQKCKTNKQATGIFYYTLLCILFAKKNCSWCE